MKEILFRGKRIDNGEWVEGYFADMGNKACIIKSYEAYWDESCKALRCHPSEIIPVDFSTVGQFIGLIDKNGKKIFEGDILKNESDSAMPLRIVKFQNGSFTWQNYPLKNQDYNEFSMYTLQYGETILHYWLKIGNIYDNPGMLKSKD